MAFDKNIEEFITRFVDELEDDNVAVFAGAGLSAASGHVDWGSLLRDIAGKLGLDVDKEDLVSLSQYYLNKNENNRHELNQKILNEFHYGKVPNRNHEILAHLPISTYWTTNYDKLIERALHEAGKLVDVKLSVSSLANTLDRRNAILYKMHGDVEQADTAILVKDDYEKYHQTHGPFITALSGDLVSKTFLFIGFSFTDPNLDYIFSRIRVHFQKNMRPHFCFFREVKAKEGESDKDFEYRKTKQQLVIEDLRRFNINVLLVEEYETITEVLQEIANRFRRKTIYISGSAHDYGNWKNREAENFITKLTKRLVKSGCKIVSGFGLGVGSFVINGALEEVYIGRKEHLSNELLLRPFPQGEFGQAQWNAYRKDMISYAGVAIFVFGNKLKDGQLLSADGVRREFEISVELGLIPIPIGATGFVAKELADEVIAQSQKYFGDIQWIRGEIERLNRADETPDQLVEIAVGIVKRLTE